MGQLWNSNYLKVWGANFMLNFAFMILTPLLPLYLSDEFGASKDTIGLVLSGYSLAALLLCPVGGYLVESYSRKMVLLVCYIVFTILFGGYLVAGSILFFCIVRTLHGAPMGATIVVNNTIAIDVISSSRRADGIAYFGISSNLSTAIAPAIGLAIYHVTGEFQHIFILAIVAAVIGLIINCTMKLPKHEIIRDKQPATLNSFIFLKGIPEGLNMLFFSFSFAVLTTYLAIYGKEILGKTLESGIFFLLISIGLVTSRLVGARTLRKGQIVENTTRGILISVVGYFLFAVLHDHIGVGYFVAALLIGLGNGYMFPAFQNMLIDLAPHSLRGTAISMKFIPRNLGMGLGIVIGGVVVEYFGYGTAFWIASIATAIGVLYFFLYTRKHYLTNRLK